MAGRMQKVHARCRRWGYVSALQALRALWRPTLNLALAAGLIAQTGGCTRPFFRKRADEEVAEVLAQKDKYPDWKIDNWHIYPDPKARFADPTNPDHPPMPPDDPAAYALSPNPQKPPHKDGVERVEGTGYLELIAKWDKENREARAQQEAEDKKGAEEPPIPEEEEAGPELQPDPKVEAGPQKENERMAVAKSGPQLGQEAAFEKAPPNGSPPAKSMVKDNQPQDAIQAAKERSLLDITGKPAYLLKLDQAAELAMFNSREYQDQRENLYLAALPVTQERFAFVAQLFAAQEAIRAYSGRETATGQSSNWALNNGTGFSKILPTGALLLLNFSNQTVFNFLDPKLVTSVTSLNFNAIQPLLRGGGEAVALESLTQAERNLLYQIRNFARFRKELYVEIASNNGGAINGSRFQPTGVVSSNNSVGTGGLGNSGLNPGTIPAVALALSSPIVTPSSPGSLFLSPAITPAPSGYLNTMLQKIQVYIDQENVDVLSGILLRFRGLLEGDVVGPLQVQSVEQQLLSGRTTLLVDQQDYLESLDQFKIEIGVPMTLSIEMDDSLMQPLIKQFRKARSIIENEQAAVSDANRLINLDQAPRMRPELLRLFQQSPISKGTTFSGTIRSRLADWEKLSDEDLTGRLKLLQTDVRNLLDRQADLQKLGQHLSPEEESRLRALNRQRDLGNFELNLRQYERGYVANGKPKTQEGGGWVVGGLGGWLLTRPGERQRIRQFQNVLSAWQKVLVEARDEQWVVVRNTWPDLPRCCVDGVDLVRDDLTTAQKAAAQYALEHRLDLMNTRAQLVDAWRQIAVFANALLGVFTVQYSLNASSPVGAAQPLNIGGSGNTNELILNTQLPLTRITERNNYRASLIAYQRQRRAVQEAEDLAVQVVYLELSNLRQFADTYKVQKRQIELAYLTIDSSLESLEAPTAPAAPPGQSRSSVGVDGPAALTQQLLAAQRSLPTAQNLMLSTWINYLDQRLQLYRDLELMPLDERGVWIDEIKACDCSLNAEPAGGPQLAPVGNDTRSPELMPVPAAASGKK